MIAGFQAPANGGRSPDRRIAIFDWDALPDRDYAYLLGVYLGDGHIEVMSRTARLRVWQDFQHPGVIAEIQGSMAAVMPGHKIGGWDREGCREISCYSVFWPLLFAQHGRGRKHERVITLQPWQADITAREAEAFIRGLIHSDGCRIVATQRVAGREYHYPRYFFSNRSEDIKRICCAHLDLLGIEWNRPNQIDIQISRRASVAKLDHFVGPKR